MAPETIQFDSGWLEMSAQEFALAPSLNPIHGYYSHIWTGILIADLDAEVDGLHCQGFTAWTANHISDHFDGTEKADCLHRIRITIPGTEISGTIYGYSIRGDNTDLIDSEAMKRLIFTAKNEADAIALCFHIGK